MNLVRIAAILGAIGVGLGAIGAHGLRNRVAPEMIEVWKTGVLYHLIHVLALLAVAALAAQVSSPRLVAGCFLGGIALFSGSLYLLVLTNVRVLGAITPLGGVAFLIGWVVLAATARTG